MPDKILVSTISNFLSDGLRKLSSIICPFVLINTYLGMLFSFRVLANLFTGLFKIRYDFSINFNFLHALLHFFLSSSILILIILISLPYFFLILSRYGNSAIQGTHQLAQKSIRIIFLFVFSKSLKRNSSLLRSENRLFKTSASRLTGLNPSDVKKFSLSYIIGSNVSNIAFFL